jgi:hypothetical protein
MNRDKGRVISLPVAVMACAAAFGGTAMAGETHSLGGAGLWSAYGGTTDDGRSICGITTLGPTGKRISIQQTSGQTDIDVLLRKDSWTIPPNTPLDIAVQFDSGGSFSGRAMGEGPQLVLGMSFAQSVPFMRGVRDGSVIEVTFPNGNEPIWAGGLGGSSKAIDLFNRCRSAMVGPATPTQPYATSPAPAGPVSEPTQPFAEPAAPAPPAPPAPTSTDLPPLPRAPGT